MEKTYFELGIVVGQKLEEFNSKIDGLSSEIIHLKETIESVSNEVKYLKETIGLKPLEKVERLEEIETEAETLKTAIAVTQIIMEKYLPEEEKKNMMIVRETLEKGGRVSPTESIAAMLDLSLAGLVKGEVFEEELKIRLGYDTKKLRELLESRTEKINEIVKEELDIIRDFTQASRLIKDGEYDEALNIYNSVIERDPKNLTALFSKCVVLLKGKEYKAAIECFNSVIEKDSNYKEAWLMKGVAYHGLKDLEEEGVCYDKALEIDETYGKALLNKAMLLKEKGEFEDAERCYNEAVKADPTLENYRSEFIFG